MTGRTIEGGCLCGAVRYAVTGPTHSASTCHCRMCQRASGSAFMGFFTVATADVAITGEIRSFASSAFAIRGFCPRCGSPLTMAYTHETDSIGLTMGSLDDPMDVPPELHWGVESWVPWLNVVDHLPRLTTQDDPEFVKARDSAAGPA